jgi:hypothetical protein
VSRRQRKPAARWLRRAWHQQQGADAETFRKNQPPATGRDLVEMHEIDLAGQSGRQDSDEGGASPGRNQTGTRSIAMSKAGRRRQHLSLRPDTTGSALIAAVVARVPVHNIVLVEPGMKNVIRSLYRWCHSFMKLLDQEPKLLGVARARGALAPPRPMTGFDTALQLGIRAAASGGRR